MLDSEDKTELSLLPPSFSLSLCLFFGNTAIWI
jgi:hypothetical protein